MNTQLCGHMGCPFMVTRVSVYAPWVHVDTHGAKPDHAAQQMIEPVRPPRPVVRLLADGATVDTGHALVIHDSWDEAMAHAERIMRDYRVRATYWVNVILPSRERHRLRLVRQAAMAQPIKWVPLAS